MNLLTQSLGRVYPFPTPRLEAPPKILCRVTLTRKLAKKRKQPQKNAANAKKKCYQPKENKEKDKKHASAVTLGVPRADFGHSGVALGSFSGALGWFGGALGRSWNALGASWAPLGPLGRLLDATWKNPRVWDHLVGHLLGRSWATFSHFFAFVSIVFGAS